MLVLCCNIVEGVVVCWAFIFEMDIVGVILKFDYIGFVV